MATYEPFETTVHKTHAWLADILRRMDWDDRHRAWTALRAVLHALRDRLSVEEAVALGAQLPLLVRGAYYEGWTPKDKPDRIRKKDEFLVRVAAELRGYEDVDVERLTDAVLEVIAAHISPGEASHIRRLLPRQLSELWPAQA